MGLKGDKSSEAAAEVAALLLSKISPMGGISSKKMFGGYGIFHEGKMFGMVDSKGNIFLKADEHTQPDFEAKGAQKHSRMPYFTLPEEVMEEAEALIGWVEKAIEVSK